MLSPMRHHHRASRFPFILSAVCTQTDNTRQTTKRLVPSVLLSEWRGTIVLQCGERKQYVSKGGLIVLADFWDSKLFFFAVQLEIKHFILFTFALPQTYHQRGLSHNTIQSIPRDSINSSSRLPLSSVIYLHLTSRATAPFSDTQCVCLGCDTGLLHHLATI